ncbi:MAG: hypothetical protein AB7F59_07140 [Bdellovibrionales bacterium]
MFKLFQLLLVLFFATTTLTTLYASTNDLCQNVLGGEKALAPITILKSSTPQISVSNVNELTILTYNFMSLITNAGKWEPTAPNKKTLRPNTDGLPKDPAMPEWQGRIIRTINPAFIFGQEIESTQGMLEFDKQYLGEKYESLTEKSLDGRIQSGLYADKSYPFQIETRSHKDTLWQDPAEKGQAVPLLPRDLPVYLFRTQANAKPFLILVGMHMKSKRGRPGDRDSELLRRTQFLKIGEVAQKLLTEFGKEAPIIILGDANGHSPLSPELLPLRQLGFVDTLEVRNVPILKRGTHTYHRAKITRTPEGEVKVEHPAQVTQPDMALVAPGIQKYITDADVIRYVDDQGKEWPLATSYDERAKQPSDHLAYKFTLRVRELIDASLKP